jgi:DNA-binding beta-propeller fold protein YncE
LSLWSERVQPKGGDSDLPWQRDTDVQVDPANQTLYTANGDNTVSAFDLRSCNAADLAGCATDTPGTVTLPAPGFEVTLWVAVDPPITACT